MTAWPLMNVYWGIQEQLELWLNVLHGPASEYIIICPQRLTSDPTLMAELGEVTVTLSPSSALKCWLLFISLICAFKKKNRGLAITDTRFGGGGVLLHHQNPPHPLSRKPIKRRGKIEQREKKSSLLKRTPFWRHGGTTIAHEKMDRVIVLFSDPQTERNRAPTQCRVACVRPSHVLKPRALRRGKKKPTDNRGPWKKQHIGSRTGRRGLWEDQT